MKGNTKIVIAIILFVIVIAGGIILLTNRDYTVSFDTNGANDMKSVKVRKNQKIGEITAPEKEGYDFLYWTVDGEKVDENYIVSKNNITLVAVYEKKKIVEEKEYKIIFDTDGGSDIETQTVKENALITEPNVPIKSGYIFKEWTLNNETYDFSKEVTSDITLKAVYIKEDVKTYTVKFNTDGGSKINDKIVEENKVVSKPANPTKSGYIFKEWQLNGKAYNFSAKVTDDITLKAIYELDSRKTYTITFDTNGGSNISNQAVKENELITKPSNPTKSGYTFKEWQLNGKTFNFNTKVTSDIKLKAVYDKVEIPVEIKYSSLIVDLNGGATTQTFEEKYEVGKTITLVSPSKDNYEFTGWEIVSGNSVLNGNKLIIGTSNTKIRANYRANAYGCVPGMYLPKGASSCKQCLAGSYCTGGTYQYNETSDQGIKDCTSTTQYSGVGSKTCSYVNPGYYAVGCVSNNNCKGQYQCSAGNYCKNGVSATCPQGSYSVIKAVVCTVCPAGKTTNGAGQVRCDITCANSTGVATWISPSWNSNNNTVSNSCVIATCASGYVKSGNKCVVESKTYTIKISKVDEYSPDRYLTVYENGSAITIKKLMYTDNVEVESSINGTKVTVAYADIVGETSFKVQLTNNSIVTANVS